MRFKVVLWEEDQAYVERVAQYVRHSEWCRQFMCRICTDEQSMRRAVEQWGPHLVIAREGSTMGQVNCARLVWTERSDGGVGLFKYTPMPQQMNVWLHHCVQKYGHDFRTSPFSIGVWGVCGGVGTTLIATQVAMRLMKEGSSVFLASMDEGVTEPLCEQEVVHDVSGWLYAWKQHQRVNVDAATGTHGFHRFDPHTSLREWATMEQNDMAMILEQVARCVDDCVVIDAGSRWSVFAEMVWQRVDVLLMVVPSGSIGTARLTRWLQDGTCCFGEEERVKMVFVRNKCLDATPFLWKPHCDVPYVPEWKWNPAYDDPGFYQAMTRVVEEVRVRWRREAV